MKKENIKFRCTTYEKKVLKIRAKKAGLTLSEFCRKSAFEKDIKERLSEEQIMIYKMLVTYHNNFSRIRNMYRKQNPKLRYEVAIVIAEIRTHLEKITQ